MQIRGKLATTNELIELTVVNGRIASLARADVTNANDRAIPYLAPGFLDIQVNGFAGADFNDPTTPPAQIAAALERLTQTGVTALLPTVITNSHEHIAACLRNLCNTAAEFPAVARAVQGFHVEGPFISTEDGPRGAHPRQHARQPNWDEVLRWQDAAQGQIRLITLAPEWPGALDLIERATATGIIIAIGHTAATPQQIQAAIHAGARLSTHLGNGSHAQITRHPNYIWEQLAADELWASLIIDGHHLPAAVVKCFLRAKGVARSILTTDAIAAAGCPPGRYRLGDAEIELTDQGRVCLSGTPYLAGSAAQMHELIGNTVRFSDATLGEAIQMASANPAQLLGLAEFGELAVGKRADLVLFDWDEAMASMRVNATLVAGEWQHTTT